jgi:hypothetical protein
MIGQNESDDLRCLETVALFQLLTPSACNNTIFGPKFGPKKVLLHAVVTKPRRCALFAKSRAKTPYF